MNPLDPQIGYHDGYPFGFVVGLEAVESGTQSNPSTGRSPAEEGVPAPFVDPKYVQKWSDAFAEGWKYGYLNAVQFGEAGRYQNTDPAMTAYDLGFASAYPYGYERGRVTESQRPNSITPAGAGRTPPPGWSDQKQLQWSQGFNDGWLVGWDDGRASLWPSPVKPWPFVPVQPKPPVFQVVPFAPANVQQDDNGGAEQAGGADTDAGGDGGEQKTETSYTPWIIGGLLAAAAIGGGFWYMSNRRKANPINQRDYKFYVVVGNKIESGWEYREDAQDQIKENLPPVGAKVYTRKTLVSRGIDPDDDANWGDPRFNEYRFTVRSSHHRLSKDVKDELRGFVWEHGLQGPVTITRVDPRADSVVFDVRAASAESVDAAIERLFSKASDELQDAFQIDWSRDTELEQF